MARKPRGPVGVVKPATEPYGPVYQGPESDYTNYHPAGSGVGAGVRSGSSSGGSRNTGHSTSGGGGTSYGHIDPAIQRALGVHADGILGPATRAAIINFQRSHGLAADGIVGPRTSAALFGSGGGGGATGFMPANRSKAVPEGRAAVATYNYQALLNLARQVGMPNPELMAHVAWAESTGNPRANSGQALGLWQINPSAWPMFDRNRLLNDVVYNAQAAKYVLAKQGLNAWNPSRNHGNDGGWGRFAGGVPSGPIGSPVFSGVVSGAFGNGGGGYSNEHVAVPGTLREGDGGGYVRLLQQGLHITEDGIFGPGTKGALINYQRSRGLTPDGIVGPQTANALFPGGAGGVGASGIVWPSDTRTITGNFGTQRPGHIHGGIDIGAPMGSPIYAATSGRVIDSGPASGFGNWIRVVAPDGTITVYGHMKSSDLMVHVGQQVNAGQQISRTGAEGDSTGPHLHFEVHPGGGNGVDPLAWLNNHQAGQAGGGIAGAGQDRDSIAAAFGASAALFDSDPELKSVLDEVTAEGLEPGTDAGKARFQALLQQTNWYKNHSDKARTFLTLEATDPATSKHQFVQALAQVMNSAQAMGIAMSVNEQWVLARQVAMYGLDENELKFALARHFKENNTATYSGDIGDQVNKLKALSQDYGFPAVTGQLNAAAQEILNGKSTLTNFEGALRNYAKGMFPALSAAIDGGQTVRQAAAPYLTSYGQVLERDPNTIDLSTDQTIRKALNVVPPPTKKAKGLHKDPTVPMQEVPGTPTLMPLWQFENSLRQDPRWLGTKQAVNSLTGAGSQVLKDMGLTPA